MQPPHDIYTLIPYHFPWVFVVLVLLVIVGFFVWLYRRKPSKTTQNYTIKRDYIAETRALILRLRPPDNFPPGKVQEDYFFALSVTFRKLISYRWKINTVGATAREIEPRLIMLPLSEVTIGKILSFMHRADQIKFAKQPSDLEQAQRDHQQVIDWTKQLTTTQENEQCN